MKPNEFTARIAAILGTIAETGNTGTPESNLYLFFGMDMDLYQKARYVMVEGGLIQIKSNWVTLTAHGKETADRINSLVAKN